MTLIAPRAKDIGFPVKRLLPAVQAQRVGPFIFLDHMGPATFAPDTTEGDVRPHPHIGLATVTYLFDGAMMHRDSLGVVQRIEPGAVNLMTAGRGVAHSERIPEDIRTAQARVEGMQLWLALPQEQEECDPDFAHYGAAELPVYTAPGITARVLIGALFGLTSPVRVPSPTTYVDLQLAAGARCTLPALDQELALYTAKSVLQAEGEEIPEHHVLLLPRNRACELRAAAPARCLLLGGAPLPGERHINWNFVSSRRQRIDQAREEWREQRWPRVPGETEWIPLPG